MAAHCPCQAYSRSLSSISRRLKKMTQRMFRRLVKKCDLNRYWLSCKSRVLPRTFSALNERKIPVELILQRLDVVRLRIPVEVIRND
jgi:hypothetical protein